MKRLISLLSLAMFSVAIVGCHASVDTDDTSHDSHYKKTTTYDNGTKTTKTESSTSN